MPKYVVVWTGEHSDFVHETDTPEEAINRFVDRQGDGADEKFYAFEITDDTPIYHLRAQRMEPEPVRVVADCVVNEEPELNG